MKKIFDPNKYGMAICQYCTGNGYIYYPKRQCCPKCGGFGLIKKKDERDLKKESEYFHQSH